MPDLKSSAKLSIAAPDAALFTAFSLPAAAVESEAEAKIHCHEVNACRGDSTAEVPRTNAVVTMPVKGRAGCPSRRKRATGLEASCVRMTELRCAGGVAFFGWGDGSHDEERR